MGKKRKNDSDDEELKEKTIIPTIRKTKALAKEVRAEKRKAQVVRDIIVWDGTFPKPYPYCM